MFVFSRVIYNEVVFLKYIQIIHVSQLIKKKSVVTARLEPTPSKTPLDVVLVLSPPLYQLSYHSAEGEGFNFRYIKYITTRERGIYMICIDT